MKTQKKSITSLISIGLSLIAGIGALIYGMRYAQYLDVAVILTLLAGGILGILALRIKPAAAGWLKLAATLCTAWGMGLFIVNSYNVWADAFGNLNMYGSLSGDFNFFSSEGGMVPPIILIVLMLLACIFGIIAVFGNRDAESISVKNEEAE